MTQTVAGSSIHLPWQLRYKGGARPSSTSSFVSRPPTFMNSSSELCPPTAESAFGPIVQGCRNDFDFTLTFEQAVFTIGPSAVFVLASAVRLPYLFFRRERLIEANTFKWLKVVRIFA